MLPNVEQQTATPQQAITNSNEKQEGGNFSYAALFNLPPPGQLKRASYVLFSEGVLGSETMPYIQGWREGG